MYIYYLKKKIQIGGDKEEKEEEEEEEEEDHGEIKFTLSYHMQLLPAPRVVYGISIKPSDEYRH